MKIWRNVYRACLLALAVSVFAITRPALAVVSLQPVAIRGDAAPGLPGISFSFFTDAPYINHQGEVAFETFLSNAGPGDMSIWAGTPGDLDLVAREGNEAPGTGGINYSTSSGFTLRGIADNRQALYSSYLDPNDPGVTSSNNEAYWFGAAGSVNQIFRKGDPTPTSSYLNTSGLPFIKFNPAGNLGYTFIDAFYGAPGSVAQLNLLDQPAPGAGDDRIGGFSGAHLNSSGQMTVFSSLYDPETMSTSGHGWWFIDPSAPNPLQKIAVGTLNGDEGTTPGDMAPGTNHTFGSFGGSTRLNDAGQVVLFASAGSNSGTTKGIWLGQPGQLNLMVQEGDMAPIAGGQHTIQELTAADNGFTTAPQIGGKGDVVFVGKLAGPDVTTASDRALLLGDSSTNLRVVAREGERAPGTPDGVVFDHFAHVPEADYTEPAINALGQVVYHAILNGPGIDESNDVGLWAMDAVGQSHLIVREGQMVELEPGLTGTIENFYFNVGTGGEDGRGIGVNDDGQIALRIRLDNTSVSQRDIAIVTAQIPRRDPDFNGDTYVDGADLTEWSEQYGQASGASHSEGDADFDGDVDGHDFLTWQRGHNPAAQTLATSQPIPEPTTLALAACALLDTLLSPTFRRRP